MIIQEPTTNCYCNFCGNPLRFPVARVGELVNCFNCSMETILFIPGLSAPYSEERYFLEARDVSWVKANFGLRNLTGVIANTSGRDLDWVRVEFILYSPAGIPVGTTSDCIIDFCSGKNWKFHAPVAQPNALRASEALLSCEYGRMTKPKLNTALPRPSAPTPMAA